MGRDKNGEEQEIVVGDGEAGKARKAFQSFLVLREYRIARGNNRIASDFDTAF